MSRTAREIKVKPSELSNDNVSVHIGAMENRESPSTIYISMGFWTRPIDEMVNAREKLHREIGDCYRTIEADRISDDPHFPDKNNNIFIINMPDNFNYNEKRNYVNIELYLHTSNIRSKNKIPLVAKKNNTLYESALRVAEAFISSELMMDKRGFEVRRTNRC